MTIDGSMIWALVVSVGMLFLGNALRASTSKANEERKSARAVEDRLLMVETKMVEEARVREIINECVADIKQGQVEIRGDIKGLTGEIHDLAQLMTKHNMSG